MRLTPGSQTGLRVVDPTTVIEGPSAIVASADLGADVVKAENIYGHLSRGVGAHRHDSREHLIEVK